MDVSSVQPANHSSSRSSTPAFVNVGNTCTDTVTGSGSPATYLLPSSNQINGGGGFTALTTKFADAEDSVRRHRVRSHVEHDAHAGGRDEVLHR